MKNKLFFSGIIGILLIFGLFVACDNGTTTKTVTVTVPGDPVIDPGPVITLDPPMNAGELRKKLLDAEEQYNNNTEPNKPRVNIPVTTEISIQGNSSITVPNGVILEIVKGARLTIESNGYFFVKPRGEVHVRGELFMDDFANGDDVRQTKIEGKLYVIGGLFYDKSDSGIQLQYVTSIRDGGRLYFTGGALASGPHREDRVFGTPVFKSTNEEKPGEIRLKFSDNWAPNKPVVPAAGTNILTYYGVTAANTALPYLTGIEIDGDITITEGDFLIPDRNALGGPSHTEKSSN